MISELTRMVRFGLVGVGNTLLTLAVFAVLTGGNAVDAAAASAIAFAVGAANGYAWNRRWTFRVGPGNAATIARYVAVQALGAGLSAGGIALASSDLNLKRLAAEAVVLPVVTLVTYTLSRHVVFRAPEPA
ncbi:GtrA family protein [Baekduia soli]|nr:GtrA family protein [Baekduia soli]